MLAWHVWIWVFFNYYYQLAFIILRQSSREWRNGIGEKDSGHTDEQVLVNIEVGAEVKDRLKKISGMFNWVLKMVWRTSIRH